MCTMVYIQILFDKGVNNIFLEKKNPTICDVGIYILFKHVPKHVYNIII